MAHITPFRAVRYNTEKIDRLEDVVTPPYDVIDDRAQAAFLAKNPFNMIQLDLSKRMGGGDAGEDRYGAAARLFQKWLQENILIEDSRPAIYLYFIDYTHPSGRRLTRKGFVSLVRLADFSEGVVKPHEKTFASVTDDRLRLMETSSAQFSQIFSLYSDPAGEVMTALERAAEKTPLCEVVDQDGCCHRLLRVTDEAAIAAAGRAFTDKSLYIADGHHRYTTALRLRDRMRQSRPDFTDDDPFNQVAMYLCPMEDEGLSILPTHRLVSLPGAVLNADVVLEKLRPCFLIEELNSGSREELVGEVLARIDEYDGAATVLGLYHAGDDRCFFLSLRSDCQRGTSADQPEALRDLDVVVLSELILGELLGLGHEQCEKEDLVEYFSDPDDALDLAVKEANAREDATPLLFLLNATTVEQVRRIADENLFMPHKSTYFYPKILTGLVIRKIT